MIQLFNSMSGQKEPLDVGDQQLIKLYVCGLTVYDEAHIGHIRCLLFFDVLSRYLRTRGYSVTYVRNITDIDDKIIKRAHEEDIPWQDLTQRVIADIAQKEQQLGLAVPDHEPRATEYIEQMISLIQTLMDRGHAYLSDAGDVCFRVSSFPGYGALSKQNLDQLHHGHRVSAEGKESSMDFVLWKKSKPEEPSWPSPWGEGRPGWHIECSAMAQTLLGDTFDIHGGGIDLKFPHHENEIAQSRCGTHGSFARCWMHVGHVRVDDEKMSKSLGNFITIRELLSKYHPELIKLYLLKTHYRQPLNYTQSGIVAAQKTLLGLYQSIWGIVCGVFDPKNIYWARFQDALADDVNTAEALVVMYELSHVLNKQSDRQEKEESVAVLLEMGKVFGVLQDPPDDFLHRAMDVSSVETKLDLRQQARKEGDYATADSIRDALFSQGVGLSDVQGKTRWYNEYAGILDREEGK